MCLDEAGAVRFRRRTAALRLVDSASCLSALAKDTRLRRTGGHFPRSQRGQLSRPADPVGRLPVPGRAAVRAAVYARRRRHARGAVDETAALERPLLYDHFRRWLIAAVTANRLHGSRGSRSSARGRDPAGHSRILRGPAAAPQRLKGAAGRGQRSFGGGLAGGKGDGYCLTGETVDADAARVRARCRQPEAKPA